MTGDARKNPPCVFIVGCGRSGTTLIYEALARHADSAWFSTWTDRTLRPELAVFNVAFKRGAHSRRLGPRPSEGYRLWDSALDAAPPLPSGVLRRQDAGEHLARRVRTVIDGHRRFGGGSLFVNKNTRNTRRVLFLDALVEARFIHVIRSPLDTVASILEIAWWKDLPLWWRDGATPRTLSRDPLDSARLAGELWSHEVSAALDATRSLPTGRHIEIRYEEFVRDLSAHLEMLFDWLGLPAEARALRGTPASQDQVNSYGRRLSPAQIEEAWKAVEPAAARVGYSS